MKKQITIPRFDDWLIETIMQRTRETRPLVESNVKEAEGLMSDLGEKIRAEFPQYKVKISHPRAYDTFEVLHHGVMGELTRLTVRQNKFFGRKIMVIDVLSHDKGNDVKYNFNEFNDPLSDEKLSNYVKQYFKERGMYMWMR